MESGYLEMMEIMLKDMEAAPAEFKPTNFWDGGVSLLVKDLREFGFSNFRELDSSLSYFVPNYGGKFYNRWQKRIDGLLNRLPERRRKSFAKAITGLERARTDYRLFQATTTHSALKLEEIEESKSGKGERFEFAGKPYSRSMLNYLRALTLLEKTVDVGKLKTWLEIGGGYGTLGEIILKGQSDSFYMNVDIPPVAAVSTYYLQQVFGKENVLGYDESREMEVYDISELRKKYKAVVLCPWQLPRLKGQFDVFANFISFQEMEPHVVQNYVKILQPRVAQNVLMRNSRYGKALASKEGDTGVMQIVTTDTAIDAFDEFSIVARDSLLHGDETPDRSFRSEVIVMSRKE